MAKLINNAAVEGLFDGEPAVDSSEFTVFTSNVLIEKMADQVLWTDGELNYTIEVSNPDPEETDLPVTGVVLTDTIDPTIAQLVLDSVKRDGTDLDPAATPGSPTLGEYDYDPVTGILTIPLGDILPNDSTTITFQVEPVA